MAREKYLSGMRGFTLVWIGQLVSLLGTGMTNFALTIWAWEKTGEATALTLVGFFFVVTISLFLIFVANEFILFPTEQTEKYIVHFSTPKGTRLERTDQALRKIMIDIKKVLNKFTCLKIYCRKHLCIWPGR